MMGTWAGSEWVNCRDQIVGDVMRGADAIPAGERGLNGSKGGLVGVIDTEALVPWCGGDDRGRLAAVRGAAVMRSGHDPDLGVVLDARCAHHVVPFVAVRY